MERSKQPVGVFKGRIADSRAQRSLLRRTDIESLMEDEDSFEPVFRYADRQQTSRPEQGRGSRIGGMGRDTRDSED